MSKRRFDGKMIGALFILIVSVCLSAYASPLRSDSWTLNPSDFRYDMTLYFSTSSKGYDNLEAYEIGAFIDDECRGLAENLELPDGGSCLYMRIRSNSADSEEVVFKMLEKSSGNVTVLKGKDGKAFLFEPDGMVGLPSDPYILAPYYNVTIEAGENGSVDFTDGEYADGTVIEVEAVPAEGYHFEKWSDGVTEAKRTVTVDSDITLTATFAVNSYQAVFVIDGEEIATLTIPYGSKIEAPEAPEKEGYSFDGWEDLPETMPAHDIVINGKMTPVEVTVYYNVIINAGENGSVDFTDGEYVEGTVIEVEAVPAEGYHFEKWSDGVTEAKRTVTVDSDITLTATFAVNSYQAVFVIDGEEIASLTIPYGSKIEAPEAPEKEGYTFGGWEDLPETMPAHDIVINGKMTPDEISAIEGLISDKNETLNVYNINGVLLYKNVKAGMLKESLSQGLYIIKGKKVMVK